jgi:hypothetical protein
MSQHSKLFSSSNVKKNMEIMSVIENDVTIVNEGPGDQEKKERTETEDFLFSFLNKNEDVAP